MDSIGWRMITVKSGKAQQAGTKALRDRCKRCASGLVGERLANDHFPGARLVIERQGDRELPGAALEWNGPAIIVHGLPGRTPHFEMDCDIRDVLARLPGGLGA